MSARTRVVLEIGSRWTFACALDWPGWCRAGKGVQAALDGLMDYAPRYVAIAGAGFKPGTLEVVGEVEGDATTDFGAPSASGVWDDEQLAPAEARRLASLLESAWRVFDDVVTHAPPALAEGPRGGGRDRDEIVAHVREAERSYARKLGIRLPPRTPWPDQRAALVEAILAQAPGTPWTPRYALRRVTWHVTDHAWEIEDRTRSAGERTRTSIPEGTGT